MYTFDFTAFIIIQKLGNLKKYKSNFDKNMLYQETQFLAWLMSYMLCYGQNVEHTILLADYTSQHNLYTCLNYRIHTSFGW